MIPSLHLCPRCSDHAGALIRGFGALHEDVCARCRGRFLSAEAVERLLVEEHGLSREMLREMVTLFASRERATCPGCASKLSPIHVRGVRIDLCIGCGGVWLDAGELTRLGAGRHEELSPSSEPPADGEALPIALGEAAPSASPAEARPSSAIDDRTMVFAGSLDPVPLEALQAAFARVPGLTAIDSAMVARRNDGVLLEGVSKEAAQTAVAALASAGVLAMVADDSWATLPAVTSTLSAEATARGIVFGRGDPTSTLEVSWSSVLALAAGELRRESMRRVAPSRPRMLDDAHGSPEDHTELQIVETDDAFLDVVLAEPYRRVRLARSRALFGESGRGRDRTAVFCERVAQIGRLVGAGSALGRGVRACLEGRRLPRYRSVRELEREESWLLWRYHGPGVSLGAVR